MSEVHHAIGLSMHQPPGNLLALHASDRHEARQILWCYDRVTRMLEGYEDVARLHLMFSGTLLKQFEDPAIAATFAGAVDVEDMLARYRRCQNIEYLGSGLYHPVFPLIPPADWLAQAGWWHGLGKKLLGREWFPGFCPPEIAFCKELIPTLAQLGYRYVIVDCWYLAPRGELRWEELRYRPHVARHDGAEIIVVPLDRELSNAQSSGTSPWWLEKEIAARTRHCDFPALVTTWSDGENGGWFRNPEIGASFWGHLYRPLLDQQRRGTLAYRHTSINEYLDRYGAGEEVDVQPGAWNTDQHWGGDFRQWTGSLLQQRGFDEIKKVSAYYHLLAEEIHTRGGELRDAARAHALLAQGYDALLVAETSCNFYWGSAWVHRSFDELERCNRLLDAAKQELPD